MKTYTVTVDGEEFQVSIESGEVVALNGTPVAPVPVEQIARNQYNLLLDGASMTIAAGGSAGRYEAFSEARLYHVQVVSERERFRKQLAGTPHLPVRTEVRAPMPAMVVKVEVNQGDSVYEGQGLVTLEAMKMENEIKAHTAGKVKKICVTAGEAVEKDELLILLE